jgi:hypothetical protein
MRPLASDLTNPHWRRERATTLLLVLVSKRYLWQEIGKLMHEGSGSRCFPRSAPIAQGIEQRFPKT